MNDGFDVDDLNSGALEGAVNNSFRRETSAKLEDQSESRIRSGSASGPLKKTTGELGPETSVSNASVASPNQEIRSPASADAAKTSKAQASKDPISQSLASSE